MTLCGMIHLNMATFTCKMKLNSLNITLKSVILRLYLQCLIYIKKEVDNCVSAKLVLPLMIMF